MLSAGSGRLNWLFMVLTVTRTTSARAHREELVRVKLRDTEEVDELEDAERVHEDEYNEPPRLSAACRVPEGESFPERGPNDEEYERYEDDRRTINKRVELCLCHMRRLYG